MAKILKIKSRKQLGLAPPLLKKAAAEPETPEKYLDMIRLSPLNQKAYSRLMIIYRKQKESGKELAVINKAIKTFEQAYRSKKATNPKIQSLSRQLNRQLGLTDSKGKALADREPIASWKKRKELLDQI